MTRKPGPRFSIIPAWAVTDPRIDASALRVLCLLGKHTNNDGWCRRSQTKMAEELGCSRSTVQRGIDVLVSIGCVQVQAGGRPSRSADPEKQPFAAHYYRVILDITDAEDASLDSSGIEEEVPASGHPPVPTSGHPPVPTSGHPGAQPRRAPIYERPPSNDIAKELGLFKQPRAQLPDTAALTGRVGKLASDPRVDRLREMFGDASFQSYFGDAEFLDGPPLKVVVRREAQRVMLKGKHFDKIARAFNDPDVMILLGDAADA
jgi:hypothetical protein